jgi:hypothetical protein
MVGQGLTPVITGETKSPRFRSTRLRVMRRRIDLPRAYELAQRQIAPMRRNDHPGLTAPATCPETLDQLLEASVEDLEAAFSARSLA